MAPTNRPNRRRTGANWHILHGCAAADAANARKLPPHPGGSQCTLARRRIGSPAPPAPRPSAGAPAVGGGRGQAAAGPISNHYGAMEHGTTECVATECVATGCVTTESEGSP
ncbi:hypothetical protein caldi_03190 [Caldinitratiruptor microaerophilus]|uniref:Uncharacterized protein n=1 Tax=Caldinitratiruptor microaerophilus TaxID=671077 RepID=A0AA35CIS4_9FIRM|nr:hypothetical protein caldi_03190 [Caldinitratiruptor microaerophilus]